MWKRKTIFPIIALALLIQPLPLLSVPSPDFDGDGTVGFPDFLAFVEHFGTSRGDGKYEAKYDLDGNGTVEFSDFLAFVNDFGKDVPPSDGDSTPVVIPDANLRAVIADSLGKASGEAIIAVDMATLTRLEVPNKEIHDLTGLEFATNLTWLDLGSEFVSGSGGGYINNNNISDFSPLSSLTSLERLYLDNTDIPDISVLSGLPNLTLLDLSYNSILDYSPLSKLTSLEGLSLRRIYLADISDLISVLSGLPNLTLLDLSSNDTISDFSPLSSLPNLTRLSLISSSISDVSWISSLTNLEWLTLSYNDISDITPLSNLTNLETVWLGNNNISDISAVANMTNLEWLRLERNSISDISALSDLTNLRSLWLSRNSISDISALSGLTSLTSLYSYNCLISDITPLSNLTRLERLSLNNYNIQGLSYNNISDITPLSNLTNLRMLSLRINSISDLAPLVANTGLGDGDQVDMRSNPLSATSLNTHIPALQDRGVAVRFGASKPAVQKNEDLRDILGAVMKSFGDEEWKAEEYIYNRGNVDRLERR